MSEQLIQGVTESSVLSDIEAEVSWTVSNRPPEVTLSFAGLHEPVELWTELTAIGWVVPGMPPRPANAIEWTPDPVAGTDFTVLPWRASDFRLEEGTWTVEEDQVGVRTLDALLDHAATIIGTSDQIAEHAAAYEIRKAERDKAAQNPVQATPVAETPIAQSPPAQSPDTPTPHSFGIGTIPNPVADADQLIHETSAQPVDAASTATNQASTAPTETGVGSRFILLLGFESGNDPAPASGTWKGISGRQRTEVAWSEMSLAASEAISGSEHIAAQATNGAAAWCADTDADLLSTTAPSGMRIVRLFVPDLSVNDAKVRRMNKLLGDDLEAHQLRSLAGGQASAVLITAAVNANSFDMLKSNLTLRMPKAVMRVPA